MKSPFEHFTATITSDQIPEGCKYVTQESDGNIDFFNKQPKINTGNFQYWATATGVMYRHTIEGSPENKNWKQAITTPEEIKAYEEWLSDGWITWNGSEFYPETEGTLVEIEFLDGCTAKDSVENFRWNKLGLYGDIIAYRVIQEAPKQEPNYKEILKFVTGEKFDQTVADYGKLDAAKNLLEQHGYSVTKIS